MKTAIYIIILIICASFIGGFLVEGGAEMSTVIITTQYDVFGDQPENITQDIQERADRVENAVYNTLWGRVSDKDVHRMIENEKLRSTIYSISYSEDDLNISKKYRMYLTEASDVISATGGNLSNQTTINKIDKELAQMNAAKQKLY